MTFIERKQKMEYLLYLIANGRCLSLKEISEKFECSERTIKRMVSCLKEEGNPVKYCKKLKKYILNA